MNALLLVSVIVAAVFADEPQIITYGPCLDDGSCPMPLGLCITESMECVGIDDPTRFGEFEPAAAFDFASHPDIIQYGPCLDDGSCPMPNGVCLTEVMECVGFEGVEETQIEEPTNATRAFAFDEIAANFEPKIDVEMELRGDVFGIKTEL